MGIRARYKFFAIVLFLALAIINENVAQSQEVVNDLVELTHSDKSFDSTPVQDGPAGKFTITATFVNTSSMPINHLFFKVIELSGNNMLLNADAGPGGVGVTLTPDLGDDVFSPGESLVVDFEIGLQILEKFNFTVDLLGDLSEENHPPVADAGNDQKVLVGDAVQLDGSDSFDIDGDSLTFRWLITAVPAGSGATLLNSASVNPTFVADVSGTYVAQLIVNDGISDSVASTVIIIASVLPEVTLLAIDTIATEVGGQSAIFRITRTGSTTDPLTVFYVISGSATNGTDYQTITESVTIPSGSNIVEVTITPIDDSEDESFETVVLSLTDETTYIVGTPSGDSVRIIDNDAVVTITASDPNASEVNDDLGVFTFTRSGGDLTTQLVVLAKRSGTATNGIDYRQLGNLVLSTISVVIPANETELMVTITPFGDNFVEEDETVIIAIDPDAAYTIGLPDSAEVTIANGPSVIPGNNLAQGIGVTTNVSSSFSSSFGPERAIDSNLNTSWFTARGDAVSLGTTPFFEVILPGLATVTDLLMFGNREFPTGFDFLAGIFQLFDESGTELFNSGEVLLPAPDRNITLAIPNISGVKRIRFTATDDEGRDPGFAELAIIGQFTN